jgi:hypothetical protein
MNTNYVATYFAIFSTLLSLFIPLWPKYSPMRLVLKHPHVCCYLNLRDQVSHPYRTTNKIIIVYILTFTFLDGSREDKIF